MTNRPWQLLVLTLVAGCGPDPAGLPTTATAAITVQQVGTTVVHSTTTRVSLAKTDYKIECVRTVVYPHFVEPALGALAGAARQPLPNVSNVEINLRVETDSPAEAEPFELTAFVDGTTSSSGANAATAWATVAQQSGETAQLDMLSYIAGVGCTLAGGTPSCFTGDFAAAWQ
jgi:hypothetical protein